MKSSMFFLFGLAIVCLASCGRNLSHSSEGVINIENAIQIEKDVALSELCDSIECIPLETNDLSLLNNRAYLLYGDESSLFVKSDEYIYHFSSDGHFLNRIGQRGDAPHEYNRIYSVSVDSINERFLFYIGDNKVQLWGYDGVFQKEIRLKTEKQITDICVLNGNGILAENRLYSDNGLDISVAVFDMEGGLVKEMPMNRYKQLINISMYTTPIMYSKNEKVRYKDIYDNILYTIDSDTVIQQFMFEFGRYMPSREYFEDMNKRETLLKSMVQLVDICESDLNLYILLVHDKSLRGLVVDKKTLRMEYSQIIDMPQNGGGIKNDYIAGSHFWPSYISNSNVMYGLLSIEHISDEGMRDIGRRLQTLIHEDEEQNPLVLKVYPKKRAMEN